MTSDNNDKITIEKKKKTIITMTMSITISIINIKTMKIITTCSNFK